MKTKLLLAMALLIFGSAFAGTDPLPTFPGSVLTTAGSPNAGTNCIQTLTFGATITGGTFTLAYEGKTTAAITWSSTNATLVSNIDTALEALATISNAAGGGVITTAGTITSGAGGTVTVTMTGNNAKLLTPAITVANNSMTGSAATLTAAITTAGVTADGRSSKIGQLLIDSTNAVLYQNTGTSLNPTWTTVPTAASVLLQSAPVFTSGLTASGSSTNDFSGSTGTFKTSTGANTLGGAVSEADATTPSITTATGSTNTGFVQVLGKTSGGLKITTADATAQTLTVTAAAQTVGAATLTIPNLASVSDTVAMVTLAQTLSNKTFIAPVLGVATGTSLAVTGLLTSSSPSAGIGYATGAGGTVTQASTRATGVTLSKTSGVITTNTTSLAAAAHADFVVTNTQVALTDTVIANITSGGTGSPRVDVVAVAAGSFTLRVTNDHASTADTSADIINFTVLKGVSS